MTDKQIINGIKYEKLTQDQLHDLSQWELVDIILAYRKDLKAKKKECKELKSAFVRAECQIADDEILQCDMREAIEELKAENEELKRQHQGDKGLITSTGKMNYQLIQEYDKLKQTLTEIKEIAITGLEGFCPKCSRKECEDNNCIETAIRDILQKIGECEVE